MSQPKNTIRKYQINTFLQRENMPIGQSMLRMYRDHLYIDAALLSKRNNLKVEST